MSRKRKRSKVVCRHEGIRCLQWHQFENLKLHLRSSCGLCGKFTGFVRQTPETIQASRDQHLECVRTTWGVVDRFRPTGGVALDEEPVEIDEGWLSGLLGTPERHAEDELIEEIDAFWAPDLPSDPEQEPELLEGW